MRRLIRVSTVCLCPTKRKLGLHVLNDGFMCSKKPSHRDGSFDTNNICFGKEERKLIDNFKIYLED